MIIKLFKHENDGEKKWDAHSHSLFMCQPVYINFTKKINMI